EDLLYISDYYGVHVFSYRNRVHVGDIYGFASPTGLCSDRAGNVFVTDPPTYHVYEYRHGSTKRVKVFYDDYIDFGPWDCSVDAVTENLAATSQDGSIVVIFPKEQEKPQTYYDPHAILFWCAYDADGNLYVDQVRYHGRQYIGVLPKGSTKFTNFMLDRRAGDAGALQFDGKQIVVDDLDANILHRLRFSGSKATVVGSTALGGAKAVEQFTLYKRRVIGPDLYGSVYFWKYPAGGSVRSSLQGFTLTQGSTISVKPSGVMDPVHK
ncbi:MAG: hypothetical protein JO033_08355, partial [Acidobacteriaceae bacterium]|nr:hypothetical protein [Acidobacteriaceae bacterium]